ncbi:MAG: hypothetical protein HY784_15495, partial [Chloroflexi bacterium]|nr:hypothetical protein [Chloroflexota bacterium]
MTAEDKKARLLAELREARACLLAEAERLPPDSRDAAFLGHWSVKHLLAHLAGWDLTNLEAAGEILAGQAPAFYAHRDR